MTDPYQIKSEVRVKQSFLKYTYIDSKGGKFISH